MAAGSGPSGRGGETGTTAWARAVPGRPDQVRDDGQRRDDLGNPITVDPETGATPDGTDEQAAVAFASVRRVLAAAGGTTADIVKCTVLVRDRAIRPVEGRPLP